MRSSSLVLGRGAATVGVIVGDATAFVVNGREISFVRVGGVDAEADPGQESVSDSLPEQDVLHDSVTGG